MIRQEYCKSGFPICATVPVICVDENFRIHVASNKYDLKTILQNHKIKICHGIWPGKKNSDCFILDPEAYVNMPTPPEDHKDIDNAKEIVVYLDSTGDFDKIIYLSPEFDVKIATHNHLVYAYLRVSGIKFSTILE